MANDLTRRRFLAVTGGGTVAMLAGAPALALNSAQAEHLIDQVVARINSVINSGGSEGAMLAEFERIFGDYADVNFIAFKTLGPPARSATNAQMQAYSRAFQGYMARKYGRRFREFIGGRVEVIEARAVKSFFEVKTLTKLRGRAPFDVSFFVSDKSGRSLFFDMRIEGISLVNSEATEIRAMLDRRRGDLDQMINDLTRAG